MTNLKIAKTILIKFEKKGVETRILNELESELSKLTPLEITQVWNAELDEELTNSSNFKEAKDVAFEFLTDIDAFNFLKTP